jgi:hypothetical protein
MGQPFLGANRRMLAPHLTVGVARELQIRSGSRVSDSSNGASVGIPVTDVVHAVRQLVWGAPST